MSKPYINTTVYDADANNLDNIKGIVSAELSAYTSFPVGKTNISVCPLCFDTETTTITTPGGIKCAFIYMLQIQVGSVTVLARTKSVMMPILNHINDTAKALGVTVICGIANIKYEWSFLCKSFMAMDDDANVPIYLGRMEPLVANVGAIRFVDINRMTNSSLAKIGKDYCTTQKLKGDLDYKIIRNSLTPLTDKERAYCINDVVVGAEYLIYMHQRFTANGEAMPMTATGIPRNLMKAAAYAKDDNGKPLYANTLAAIKAGYPSRYDEYEHLMRYLFRGGYTHGSEYYAGMTLENVEHVDYTSDYPACMLQHKYATIFETKTLEYNGNTIDVQKYASEKGLNGLLQFEEDIAFYFTATFTNIERTTSHSVESSSKAVEISDDAVIDNGRIAKAGRLVVILTEQDYIIYKRLYKWDSMKVTNLHMGVKYPLPLYVIDAIVTSYVDKKRLKDQGLSYAAEKALLNSIYGCTVQRINVTGRREVYDYKNDDVITIETPVPAGFLLPTTKRNNDYLTRYIPETIARRYGYANNSALAAMVKRVARRMYDGKAPKVDDDVYMNIYSVIVEKLRSRAYNEEKNGTQQNEEGRRIGRPKILSCWWGVWVTAYARRRLLEMTADLEEYAEANGLEPIVIYSDTDSAFMNAHQSPECWEFVKKKIDDYNARTEHFNATTLAKYDNSGLLNDIGLFTWEPIAYKFKHLGAKRYLQYLRNKVKNKRYRLSGKRKGTAHGPRKMVIKSRYYIESTVAGLNKKDFANKVNGLKIDERAATVEEKFDYFSDQMTFTEEETNKMRPIFNTKPYSAEVVDAYGNAETMHEDCGQVLESVGFKLSLIGNLLYKVNHIDHRLG